MDSSTTVLKKARVNIVDTVRRLGARVAADQRNLSVTEHKHVGVVWCRNRRHLRYWDGGQYLYGKTASPSLPHRGIPVATSLAETAKGLAARRLSVIAVVFPAGGSLHSAGGGGALVLCARGVCCGSCVLLCGVFVCAFVLVRCVHPLFVAIPCLVFFVVSSFQIRGSPYIDCPCSPR